MVPNNCCKLVRRPDHTRSRGDVVSWAAVCAVGRLAGVHRQIFDDPGIQPSILVIRPGGNTSASFSLGSKNSVQVRIFAVKDIHVHRVNQPQFIHGFERCVFAEIGRLQAQVRIRLRATMPVLLVLVLLQVTIEAARSGVMRGSNSSAFALSDVHVQF